MPTLRELRDRAFLSQQELADEAVVSKRTIERLEAGAHRPRGRTVRKLASALKVHPREIYLPLRRRQRLQQLRNL